MADPETLKLVAEKSKFLIDSQLESYRNKQANAGIVIGIIALFIPVFLSGFESSYNVLKVFAIIPLAILLICLLLLLIKVLFAKPLGRGMKQDNFDVLVNQKYSEALLFEIGANRTAWQINDDELKKIIHNYNIAVILSAIAIIFASVLLFIDKLAHPQKSEIQKVEIIKNLSHE